MRVSLPSGSLDPLDQPEISRRINGGLSDRLAHVKTGEGLTVFEEEVPSLSGDLRARNVAGKGVPHSLDPGGEVLDVSTQPVGVGIIEI